MSESTLKDIVCACKRGEGNQFSGKQSEAAISRLNHMSGAGHDLLKEADDLLRSAYQIASREGSETNRPAFQRRLEAAPEKHNEILKILDEIKETGQFE